MINRYISDREGNTKKLAAIYTKDEHKIEKHKIDSEALFICDRLRRADFKSYIVGGAVRDLILAKQPKDFDIVTDAHPTVIRKIFRNSRIIGKRFKLVHVCLGDNIYEVSTFRSGENQGNNIFGTMAEDVWRRDFTINALYYCPKTQQIIDFTGGYKDLKHHLVKPVIPLNRIFLEDPVRIIRAVKYSVIIDGDIPILVKMRIKKHAKELVFCSASRLTEELIKIMRTGYSAEIIKRLAVLKILKIIHHNFFEIQKNKKFYDRLKNFDRKIKENPGKVLEIYILLQPLIEDFIIDKLKSETEPVITVKELIEEVKLFLRPLTPPNKDIAEAIKKILKRNGIKLRQSAGIRLKANNTSIL